jgi:DNA polymerase delta subunit 1
MNEHLISIFGKTEGGKSVCVTTSFTPYFFIKLDLKTSKQKIQEIYVQSIGSVLNVYSVILS